MKTVTDQTSDSGFATLRVVVDRFPELKTMAKTANLDESEFSELPDESFAWPGIRRFPIHTPQHAALSYGYSKLASVIPSDVREMLEKAADVYQIDRTVFEPPVEIMKTASSSQFLLPEKRRFRVDSAEVVPDAERVYHEKYAELSVTERAEAGYRLMKVAKEYSVKLKPETQKLAGFTITSTRVLRDWVGARHAAATKLGSDLAGVFDLIDDEFRGADAYIADRDYQLKIAQVISDMDKKAGLTQFYGKRLPDPIQTVFNTTEDPDDYFKFGSALQNKELLASLPLSFWQDTLGPDVAQEIAPNGQVDAGLLEQILPTLPADLKAAIETQLAAYNK